MDVDWRRNQEKFLRMKGSFIMNYGEFGGQYVPQELKEKLNEIQMEFERAKTEENFSKEYLY